MRVELFDARDAGRLAQAFAIRTRVFVDEQGVPASEEIDVHDLAARTRHGLAYDGNRAIAAGRYYALDSSTVQIGRMAVLAECRGRGAGRALLDALAGDARRGGYLRAHLHAQTHAKSFYRKAGFVEDGEPLIDADILHQPMSASLGDYCER